jgi:ABC-type transporter Mla subunit MlaD
MTCKPGFVPFRWLGVLGCTTALFGMAACGSSTGSTNASSFDVRLHAAATRGVGPGDEVRVGWKRVGRVIRISRAELASGAHAWQVELVLSSLPLPVDSAAELCPTADGNKPYVAIRRGHVAQAIPNGGVLQASQVSTPRVCR